MRATALLLVLALAGCLGGGPAPSPSTPGNGTVTTTTPASSTPVSSTPVTPTPTLPTQHVDAGPWTIAWEGAGTILGQFGDDAWLNGTVTLREGDARGASLVVQGPFVTLNEMAPFGVPLRNGTTSFSAHFAFRTDSVLAFTIYDENRSWSAEGPEIVVAHVEPRLPPRERHDPDATVPAGLSVRAENGSVVATYASRSVRADSCGETVLPERDWEVQREGADVTLVGFVIVASSDACAPVPPERGRVEVVTPAFEPGTRVTVRVLVGASCFCPPGLPWGTEEASVVVPDPVERAGVEHYENENWSVTWAPALARGPLGATYAWNATFTPKHPLAGPAYLWVGNEFVALEGESAHSTELHNGTTTVTGRAALRGEGVALSWTGGPSLFATHEEVVPGEPLEANVSSDPATAPPGGLQVRVVEGRVLVTYGADAPATNNCDRSVSLPGPWELQTRGTTTMLVGFVVDEPGSDACFPISANQPHVRVASPALPNGTKVVVRVVVGAGMGCECLPGAWRIEEREVTIG